LDQSTKQRVVGIAVIVVAAVALLPVLFDGQGSYELPIESRIPEPTPFPTPPRIIPERPTIVADSAQPELDTDTTVEPLAAVTQDQTATVTIVATEEPTVSTSDDSAPVSIDDIIASLNLDAAPRGDDSADAAPSLDSAGLPEGWSVRLASFSSEANARNLVERLQGGGHRAYMRQIESAQGPLVAVYVGPGVDRAAVQQLQQQLQEQFQLAGIVVRYEIEEL
jgi:DedD protein